MTITAMTFALRPSNGDVGPLTGVRSSIAYAGQSPPRIPARTAGVLGQGRRFVGQHDLAGLEDVPAVRDPSAISAFCSTSSTVVPCSLIVPDDLEDLLDQDRRQPQRRLVEQQDLGAPSAPGRSRASAARRRTACRPSGVALAEAREQVVDPLESAPRAPCRLRANAPSSRFSWTVMRAKTGGPRAPGRRPARRSRAAASVDALAARGDLALRGRSRPEIVRSVVDLPAPFEPISVTISPSSTSSVTPRSAWIAP